MGRVLVIGSANVDLTMGVDRLPARGETVGGGVFHQGMGGKGANQAVAARRAGAEVRFVMSTGQDANGDAVFAAMQAEGIDLEGSRRHETSATGVALILYDREGNNSIAVAPGANFDLHPDALAFDDVGKWPLLLLQNELAPRTLEVILQQARERRQPVLLNFAPAHTLSLAALVGETIALIVNETETAFLLGRPVTAGAEAMTAATELRAHGFRFVVLTLGAEGCCVAARDFCFRQPAMPVHAIDATAAGDTFCGALAVALTEESGEIDEAAMRRAIRFASAAAALSTTTAGAQASIPRRHAIDAALDSWHDEDISGVVAPKV